MREDLSDQLHRLSADVQNAVRLLQATDIRQRADQRRKRTTMGAAALSMTAVAVAAPVALNVASPDGDDHAGATPASSPTSAPESTPRSTPSPEPSLGWDRSEQEYNEAFDRLMRECMSEDGFDWVRDNSTTASQADIAAEHGFSISTNLQALPPAEPATADPIQEYREQLSADKRDRYSATLERCWNGVPENVRPPTLPTDRAVVLQGEDGDGGFRIATSSALVDPDGDGLEPDFHAAVQLMVEADPRIVSATLRWSHCMAREGYTAESPGDLRARIGEVARPYIDVYQAALPADERFPYDGPKSVSVEDALTDEQMAGLAAVQEYERAAAVASASCDDDLNDLLPVVWQDKLDEYFGYTG